MALITSHATLKTAVAEWLNRSDLSTSGSGIDLMIDNAENRLARDPRVRNLNTASFSVDADDEAAPSGFRSLEALSHDGPTYYGPLEIVAADQLSTLKSKYGATGVPKYAAIINSDGTFTFRFAPVPDATYSLKAVYWRTLTALSAGTNWLVSSHPDIYLYATLLEAAPYLMDDARLPMWAAQLEARLETLHMETWDQQWGGGVLRRHFDPIG